MCARGIWLAAVLGIGRVSPAQDLELESVGARFGASLTSREHNFLEADSTVDLKLPWQWDVGEGWWVRPRLDLSAGWLGDAGGNAAILTVGPTFILRREHSRWSFEAGTSPTFLTRYDFATTDFGLPFQFTSHLGVDYDLGSRLRLECRLQHMSNAGLNPHNPGLNLLMIGVDYVF